MTPAGRLGDINGSGLQVVKDVQTQVPEKVVAQRKLTVT
jgi:hypothetical protein